jgi:hypothetical protein
VLPKQHGMKIHFHSDLLKPAKEIEYFLLNGSASRRLSNALPYTAKLRIVQQQVREFAALLHKVNIGQTPHSVFKAIHAN